LEIFKQEKFEDEQLIRYFLFRFQFCPITKCGLVGMIAFRKCHLKKSWIILINTSITTKGIMFKKGENTISGQMKIFQGRTDPNKY
jgi:hypothetical protein